MRQSAAYAPLPAFPSESIQANSYGPAVAKIRVALDGHVISVHVLQAPDALIAAAVSETLKSWRFTSFAAPRTFTALEARMVFYFQLSGNAPRVIDAVEEYAVRQSEQEKASRVERISKP
jgi:outer membrane biosynthesis protein TonB